MIIESLLNYKNSNPDLFLGQFKILISILLIVFIILIFKFFKNYKFLLSKSFYIILLIFIISIELIFSGINNGYNWLSNHEFPLIYKDNDASNLTNDFYTNASFESQKIIFAKLFNLLNIFNIKIEILYFFYQNVNILLTVLLTFLILTNFDKNSNFYLYNNTSLSIALSFVFSLGYLNLLQQDTGFTSFSQWRFFNPLSLSNLIFLYLFYRIQKYGYFQVLNYLLMILGTLIHPLTGIYFFALIYFLLHNYKNFNFKNIFLFNYNKLFLFISLIIPLATIYFLFQSSITGITDLKYIQVYINLRHPHHYLISSFFSWFTIFWMCFIIFFIIFFYFKNNLPGLIISIYFAIVIFLSIFLQYYFSEIYLNKIISTKISPIRFFTYVMLVYVVLLNICFSLSYKNMTFIKNLKLQYFSIFLLISSIFFLTFSHKEILHRIPLASEIVNFSKNNSNFNKYYSDYESEWILSYIRSYSKKNIFSDNLFVFDDKQIINWYDKYREGNKIRLLYKKNYKDFLCKLNSNGIDVYIKANLKNNINSNFAIAFKNNSYTAINVKESLKNYKC